MLCTNVTCDKSCTNGEIFYGGESNVNEFITNLRHEKCKVVKLVRSQIHRLEDTQSSETWSVSGEVFAASTGRNGNLGKPIGNVQRPSRYTNPPQDNRNDVQNAQSRVPTAETWPKRIIHRIRQRLNLIIAGLAIGTLVWLTLVFGVLLGASFCGNGRPYLTTFRYAHAKHSLF